MKRRIVVPTGTPVPDNAKFIETTMKVVFGATMPTEHEVWEVPVDDSYSYDKFEKDMAEGKEPVVMKLNS